MMLISHPHTLILTFRNGIKRWECEMPGCGYSERFEEREMGEKDELKQRIGWLEEQLREAHQQLKAIHDREAIERSKFKIGDRITVTRGTFEISKVESSPIMPEGYPWVFGKKILKDGTVGEREFRIYHFDRLRNSK